jgi:hypothetical protein
MSVHCSTCGTQIDSAPENGGSFAVSKDFIGGYNVHQPSKVVDTCEWCAMRLTQAITTTANAIVRKARARDAKKARDEAKKTAAPQAATTATDAKTSTKEGT